MAKTRANQSNRKQKDVSSQKKIDYDAFWKNLLSAFLKEALELMHAKLHDAVVGS